MISLRDQGGLVRWSQPEYGATTLNSQEEIVWHQNSQLWCSHDTRSSRRCGHGWPTSQDVRLSGDEPTFWPANRRTVSIPFSNPCLLHHSHWSLVVPAASVQHLSLWQREYVDCSCLITRVHFQQRCCYKIGSIPMVNQYISLVEYYIPPCFRYRWRLRVVGSASDNRKSRWFQQRLPPGLQRKLLST